MEYRLNYRTRYEGWFADQDTNFPAENDADALKNANQRIERMNDHAPVHVKGYEIVYINRIEQREEKTRIYSKE